MDKLTIPEDATPLQLGAIAAFVEIAQEHGHQPSDECDTCKAYIDDLMQVPEAELRRRLLS